MKLADASFQTLKMSKRLSFVVAAVLSYVNAFSSAELLIQNEGVNYSKSLLSLFETDAIEDGNCVSTCTCCSVPCPVVGVNELTVGGGATGYYTYSIHNS